MDILGESNDGDLNQWLGRHGPRLHNPDEADFCDHCFALWSEDCFDPPIMLIWARSFEDAFEEYLDTPMGKHHVIDAVDLPDYLDENGQYEGSYNPDGDPVDTETINGTQLY